MARTLPLLLILVVFLMLASELWQTARALGWGDVIAILLLLAIVGCGLVVVRASEEIRSAQGRVSQLATIERLLDTPAAELLAERPDASADRPLRRLERLNLIVLILVSQLVQAAFVAGMVMVFLVVLGLLAVPAGVQETWIGGPGRELVGFGLLGEARMLSAELVIASALLAAMCGLYFTGLALTDSAYRIEFEARVVSEVEKIVGVRAVYLGHIADGSA